MIDETSSVSRTWIWGRTKSYNGHMLFVSSFTLISPSDVLIAAPGHQKASERAGQILVADFRSFPSRTVDMAPKRV